MPMYEYECKECGASTEVLAPRPNEVTEVAAHCETCEKVTLHARKIAGGSFKIR